jgi:N-acetylglutamate synthase-like GNAT family acetyltransferase
MEQDSAIEILIRSGTTADRVDILNLIQPYVRQKKLLQRTIDELEELMSNSFVATHGSRVVGFVALEIYSRKLAEIRSLVVAAEYQNRGVGQRLVAACVERARDRGVLEVMAISSAEPFFHSCGFDFTLPDEKKAFFRQTGDRDWRSARSERD